MTSRPCEPAPLSQLASSRYQSLSIIQRNFVKSITSFPYIAKSFPYIAKSF
jgi:hypothetical protein